MTTQLKAQFIKSTPSNGVYKIQIDIIDAVNIDFDVIVFAVEDDAFTNIATLYDLETWYTDKTAAANAGHAYYRGRGATVYYDTFAKAEQFVQVSQNRLQILVNDWESAGGTFSGTEIVTVTPES